MRVTFHTDFKPDGSDRLTAPVWPEGWPIPRVGDEINNQDGDSFEVTTVAWYPHGEHGEDDLEPFVYIVLHAPGFGRR
jgi:hypothetical protein